MTNETNSDKMRVMACVCVHDYQDQKHGQGMRLHNPTAKRDAVKKQTYRCTVCGRERTA